MWHAQQTSHDLLHTIQRALPRKSHSFVPHNVHPGVFGEGQIPQKKTSPKGRRLNTDTVSLSLFLFVFNTAELKHIKTLLYKKINHIFWDSK